MSEEKKRRTRKRRVITGGGYDERVEFRCAKSFLDALDEVVALYARSLNVPVESIDRSFVIRCAVYDKLSELKEEKANASQA